jgi:hypothetical protein
MGRGKEAETHHSGLEKENSMKRKNEKLSLSKIKK